MTTIRRVQEIIDGEGGGLFTPDQVAELTEFADSMEGTTEQMEPVVLEIICRVRTILENLSTVLSTLPAEELATEDLDDEGDIEAPDEEAPSERGHTKDLCKVLETLMKKPFLEPSDLPFIQEGVQRASRDPMGLAAKFAGREFRNEEGQRYKISGFQCNKDGAMSVNLTELKDASTDLAMRRPQHPAIKAVKEKLAKVKDWLLPKHPLECTGEEDQMDYEAIFPPEKLKALAEAVLEKGYVQTWRDEGVQYTYGELVVEIAEKYLITWIDNECGKKLEISATHGPRFRDHEHAVQFDVNNGRPKGPAYMGLNPGRISVEAFDNLYQQLMQTLKSEKGAEKSLKLTRKLISRDRNSYNDRISFAWTPGRPPYFSFGRGPFKAWDYFQAQREGIQRPKKLAGKPIDLVNW